MIKFDFQCFNIYKLLGSFHLGLEIIYIQKADEPGWLIKLNLITYYMCISIIKTRRKK